MASAGARVTLRPHPEAFEETGNREIGHAEGEDTDVERAATRIFSTLLARPLTVPPRLGGGQAMDSLLGATRTHFTDPTPGSSGEVR
jgi:hypothetical protein